MGNFLFRRRRRHRRRNRHYPESHEEGGGHGDTRHSEIVTTLTESNEYTAVMACHDKLVSSLSPDPVTIAGILLSNGFIPNEIHAKMLLPSSTPHEKANILVTAVSEKIMVTPKRFYDLIKIFLELTWTRDIAEILQSTYQGKLHGIRVGVGGGTT